jgi:GntR family transcriptional regulator, transcriptional repressor for pyruvate dehydrogenase complex
MTPRVGTIVNDYRQEGSLTLLTSLINYGEGALAPNLLTDTLKVRGLVEVETARLAAANRSDIHMAAFTDLLGREAAADHADAEAISELDFAFHHQVAMASENLIYPLLLNTFKPFYTNLTRLFFADRNVVPVVFTFHRRLVAAIEKQSEPSAVRVMRELLAHGETRLRELQADRNGAKS